MADRVHAEPVEAELRKLVHFTVAGILLIGAASAVHADEPAVAPPQGTTLRSK